MRRGHKYVEAGHTHVDASPAEFAATMGYGQRDYPDRAAFLAAFDERWIHELSAAYAGLLDRDRRVLGIGSGEGEHEVLLQEAGFDVVASDVVPGSLDAAARLFDLPVTTFDVFAPGPVQCDDVLVTGLDFYFDDDALTRILAALRALVEPDGRALFTLRYRNNPATWAIDRLGLPAVAALQRRHGVRLARKVHGYRRSPGEIRALARAAGFRVGRERHAGFGMEVTRVAPVPSWVVAADRRLHVLNTAVVFELLPAAPGTPARSPGSPGR